MSPNEAERATLLVSCPDRRGIVAALAQVLYGHGANIFDSDQHTDPLAAQFFQRLHFDLTDLQTDRGTLERAIAEVAERFGMRYEHCLYDLLLRHQSGELRCELPLIVSNHPDLERVAQQFGVEFQLVPVSAEIKPQAEAAQLALLRERSVDLVVLARYMQILSESFVTGFPGKVINIHHSFLPAFSVGKPYHQAYQRGVKLIGATAHYASAVLDEGPIIEQDVVRCSHRDSI